ncbi:hypothetical protein BG004_000805 [Podila humilis]|nr:hypothetical protein BG004_000805 [Podila humilis]
MNAVSNIVLFSIAKPQINTMVTCKSCGTFRRYYCMAGKGIEGDRYEEEKKVEPSSITAVVGENSETKAIAALTLEPAGIIADESTAGSMDCSEMSSDLGTSAVATPMDVDLEDSERRFLHPLG